jgi:hypothetical protein
MSRGQSLEKRNDYAMVCGEDGSANRYLTNSCREEPFFYYCNVGGRLVRDGSLSRWCQEVCRW